MSALKPTEEQIAWAKWWTRDDGWGGWEELADRLAEREAAAEQRGREAGIREAASECDAAARLLATLRRPTAVARFCVQIIRVLLPGPPPAAPLTGPELAQKYGCPPLAESGAARVPGVDAGPTDGEEPDR